MKKNVCGVDHALRLLAGFVSLAVALRGEGEEWTVSRTRVLAGYAAAEFLLINGALQWCPLNAALGIDTCARDWPERLRGVDEAERFDDLESLLERR